MRRRGSFPLATAQSRTAALMPFSSSAYRPVVQTSPEYGRVEEHADAGPVGERAAGDDAGPVAAAHPDTAQSPGERGEVRHESALARIAEVGKLPVDAPARIAEVGKLPVDAPARIAEVGKLSVRVRVGEPPRTLT